MLAKVGVMQGRLSPMINNRIQQFPWDSWPSEFVLASKIDIKIIEWTIDTIEFYKNPLINQRDQINLIMDKNDISIPSVTCDYFMENPPWKGNRQEVLDNLKLMIAGMDKIEASILVIPLVDNSICVEIYNQTSHR